jgi:hypothetical protein
MQTAVPVRHPGWPPAPRGPLSRRHIPCGRCSINQFDYLRHADGVDSDTKNIGAWNFSRRRHS